MTQRTAPSRRFLPRILLSMLVSALLLQCLPAQSYYYDAAGRLTQVAYRNGSGARYEYDAADNLIEVAPLELPPAPVLIRVNRLSGTSARLEWRDDSDRETSFLIMRRKSTDLGWETIAVVGRDVTSFLDESLDPDSDYVYRIVARGDDGLSAYSSELQALPVGPAGSFLDLVVQARGAERADTRNDPGTARPGYATVTVNSGVAPYGTAVFSLSQNGIVVSEAGVPASPPSTASRIFIDFRSEVPPDSGQFEGTIAINTGLAVANTNDQDTEVTYTLRDPSGNMVAGGSQVLTAGAHFAKFIDQLAEEAPDFELPTDFSSQTGFGTLDLTSTLPLSALALRLTVNQRGEALLTTTPVADLEQNPSNQPLYFPQFADGQGFTSALVLLNATANPESGIIRLFRSDGSPFTIRASDGTRSSVFVYSIPANGLFVLQTDGSSAEATAGWALLTPDPGTSSPLGSGIFQLSQGGVVVTESGIPAATLTNRARIFIDTAGGYNTGLALANPGGEDLSVDLEVYQTDGSDAPGGSPDPLVLEARGQRALFVTQLAAALPVGFKGVLDLEASGPFAALTLRSLVNSRDEFLLTTFPTADPTRSAPEPIVFPQIADGGGIQTQFIFISPGSQSGLTIRFFDDQGMPLVVGKTP